MLQKLEGLIDGKNESPEYIAERRFIYRCIYIHEYTYLAKIT